ncbi:flavin reductase family protein [Glycomyces sp. NPDC048151]|uniref:flavin reductase family protein n=1 Tax=Glycomyces sp. NPDC048151 TaxID=3364002 RepID=UPI0037118E19
MFKDAMSQVPAAVAIVMAEGGEFGAAGFTASSVCPFSASVPSLLVCVDHGTRSHRAIRAAERFTVNFLAEDQRDLAMLFATRGADKFDAPGVMRSAGGPPWVEGALASMTCVRHFDSDVEDHLILVGLVTEVRCKGMNPLIWFDRDFASPVRVGDHSPHEA